MESYYHYHRKVTTLRFRLNMLVFCCCMSEYLDNLALIVHVCIYMYTSASLFLNRKDEHV